MTNLFKKDFPILGDDRYIYFDNAATSQRPRQVTEAVRRFTDETNSNPLRGLYQWSVEATDRYEAARHRVAKFIGAKHDEEIIFTRNSTESLNLIAYSWALDNLTEGDRIVITVLEHHSDILPWQMVSKKTGAVLDYIECDEKGGISDGEIEKKIVPGTKLVCCMEVSNVLGCRLPVENITSRAHNVGAVTVVDAAQSVPHRPVNVRDLGADFLVFSGHKLMAPMGIGVLYAKLSLLENMTPFLRGGEMIESVTRYGAVWAPLPQRFEAGTVNAAGAVGLAAAIDYLEDIGFDTVREMEEKLVSLLLDGIRSVPYAEFYGSDDPKDHGGIAAFNIKDCHPHDVASILDTENICVRAGHHCAQPLHDHLGLQSTARASVYFYNDESEAERFIEALKKVRGWLGYGD